MTRLAFALAAALALPAQAQDTTLADIRQDLAVLNVEMQRLTRELSTTGGPGTQLAGTSIPDRVDSMEAQLAALTARVEAVSARVEAVSRDGGNRIEDLRFQLCELTTDCDLGALPDAGPLGGATDTAVAAAPAAPAQPSGGANLAVSEQAQFDAARSALEGGDAALAAERFGSFLQAYPSGPLSGEAKLLRASALAASGQPSEAARAYLGAFTDDPEGPGAAQALLGLGSALGRLGQASEACVTLSEIEIRFPASPTVAEARSARAELGCT